MKKWLRLLAQIGPMVLKANPKTAPFADDIASLIGEAEMVHGSQTGEAKRRHVVAAAGALAEAVNHKTGKVTVDVDQLKAATNESIGAVISVVNTVRNIPAEPEP